MNVKLNYVNGYLGEDLLRIAGKMLVVGDTVTVKVDEGQAANPGLRLTYETVFGTKYVLEFQWNGHIAQAVNQKFSVQS